MRRWKVLAVVFLCLGAVRALAQPPVEQELRDEIKRLREEMSAQKADFETKIAGLQGQIETGFKERLSQEIDDIVARKSKFYRRPDATGRIFGNYSIFDAVQGGLIFTGLFRSRFEYRANNVDFNPGDGGLDDEGVRFNGRFRLGFGAVLVRDAPTDPVITALMEFQAYGTFANNTYFTFAGPGGIPLPTEFTIFREPYEQVTLYQGYISFEQLLAEQTYIKVGRQEIVRGTEFLLGNNAFYDGTVHDAFLVEYEGITDVKLAAFFAKEAQSDTELAVIVPAADFDEDEMSGFYGQVQATEDLSFDAYAIYFNARSNFTDSFVTRSTNFAFDGAYNPALMGHFWTLGGRAFLTRIDLFGGFLALNAEAAYQTGDNGLAGVGGVGAPDRQSLHGWSGEFIANYWFDPTAEGVKPIVTLAYYYAGGGEKNDGGGNGFPLDHVGFQPMFINRHFNYVDRSSYDRPLIPGGGRYGNLDQIPLSNMHIAKAAVTIAPSDVTEVGLAGLMAITADDEGWGTGVHGYEIDLFGSYAYNPYIHFAANVSVFFPQKTADDMSDYLFFAGTGTAGRSENEPSLGFYLEALIEF